MNDDIMKAIEQVVAQADNDQERWEKEAYINSIVSSIILNARGDMGTALNALPDATALQLWANRNRHRVALQIGEVARILLRKELLGE